MTTPQSQKSRKIPRKPRNSKETGSCYKIIQWQNKRKKLRENYAFKAGDSVLLSTKNLSVEDSLGTHKLHPRFCRRFTILQMVSDVTAKLDLSAPMKAKGIHDAFHASFLKPYAKDTLERCPEKLPAIHFEVGHEEYDVEKSLTTEKNTDNFSI